MDNSTQTFASALSDATRLAAREPSAIAAPKTADSMLEVAETFVVDCPIMFEAAASELRSIITKRKSLEDARMSITRPMDEAKKAVMDLFRVPVEVATKAESILRGKITDYQKAEEERVRAERAESERKQREEFEANQKKLQAAQAEERRAIEAGNLEAARIAREDADKAMADTELAEIAPPMPVVAAPVVAGLSFRKKWKAEVTDKAKLIKHVAKTPALQNLLDVAEPELNQLATATKGAMNIPGVRFYEDTQSAVRR